MDSSSTALLVRRGSDEFSIQKELTEEMIIDIFARLPVKSLLRFKTLSKLWYSLILSPNFIAIHSTHSHINNTLPLLLESRDHSVTTDTAAGRRVTTTVSIRFGLLRKNLPFSGHLNNLEMVGCFNGVVCLSLSQRPQKYALWNPATRQIRLFGDAPIKNAPNRLYMTHGNGVWYGSGFCFDPVANDFKVAQIKLIPLEGEMTSRAQVNVLSTATSSWTEKNTHVPYRIMLDGFNVIHGATCVNRYIHWHVSISNDLMVFEDMYILSYNMVDEVFKRIEMPTRPVYGKYRLTSYKGSLAVIVHTPTDVNCTEVGVWVMTDCGGYNQSWSKILTCKLSNKSVCVLGFFRKDDVDLILFYEVPDNTLYSHDPESGVTKRFWITRCLSETFLYSESLASIK